MEHALEGVGYVYADAHGAVEGAGEVPALVRDALALLGVLLVDAVARFVRSVRTVREEYVRAVLPEVDQDLDAGPGTLGQAPLAAAAPVAAVDVAGPDGGAHGGYLANARLHGPGAGHVNRDREIHQGDRGEDRGHLADAYRAAYATVLGRYHQVLDWHWLTHGSKL